MKVKAPAPLLKTTGEFNRFSGHAKTDNFCAKCGLEKLKEAQERLKDMVAVLTDGPSDSSQLGNRKVRRI